MDAYHRSEGRRLAGERSGSGWRDSLSTVRGEFEDLRGEVEIR
jgi:hypothetical protein